MFIYLIVNHVTGKYYVGQHRGNNLKKYLQQKFYEAERKMGGRSYLYASMRKHGRAAFSIHALLSDIQTKAELDQHEKDFILFFRSRESEFGYNICKGGEGFTGPAWNKGLKTGLAPWRGKKRSPASIEKGMATKRRNGTTCPPGWNQDPEVIAARVATRTARGSYGVHRKGKKHSPETIALMREKAMGNQNRLGKRLQKV